MIEPTAAASKLPQFARACGNLDFTSGTPGPTVIGIDEVSIRKGHDYRIVVSDLIRERPIWFGGQDPICSDHVEPLLSRN
jgi:hypothetical protein